MNRLERYLTLWVFICIVVGVALGRLPALFHVIGGLSIAQANIPVGLLIWVMIIPMLVRVDFGALGQVRRHVRGIGVTLFVNWLVKPFSMALLGWVFIRHLFAPWLPAAQIDSYVAGLILLAAAPCTAMSILIQVLFNAGLAYGLNRAVGESHRIACPSALIGASNFFELAVAAAVEKRSGAHSQCRYRIHHHRISEDAAGS